MRISCARPAAGDSPSRESGQARYCELPEPERICPGSLARAKGQTAIPATRARHPKEVITLTVRDLRDGRITLNSDADGGRALTMRAPTAVRHAQGVAGMSASTTVTDPSEQPLNRGAAHPSAVVRDVRGHSHA